MPELNLLDALREFSFQNRKVLGPIDRYNVVGACQIAFVEGARAANFGYKPDTARSQTTLEYAARSARHCLLRVQAPGRAKWPASQDRAAWKGD